MNQPPITFSALVHRVLSWAFTRLYDEAQRQGMNRTQAHASILRYVLDYAELEIAIDAGLEVHDEH